MAGLKQAGVSVACFLPDSLMKELYPALVLHQDIRAIPVTNEGEGAAICGGVWLSGKRAVLVMENSGLRAAAEPLARLGLGAGIPVVMIMSYRGDLGEPNWWAIPHGITMEPMLKAMRIPYRVVRKACEVRTAIRDAYVTACTSKYHAAVILSGECIEADPSTSVSPESWRQLAQAGTQTKTPQHLSERGRGPVGTGAEEIASSASRDLQSAEPAMQPLQPVRPVPQMTRFACMQVLAAKLKDELVILSLGGSVDEWYTAAPHMREASLFQQQLGCVTPEAFGLSIGLPHRRIVSLDTDGGMLFNLGTLATLSNEQPRNLTVIVWDNQCYLSIGGPPTHTSRRVDLAAIARGAGIRHAYAVDNLTDMERLCAKALAADELYLLVAKVAPRVEPGLQRKHSDGIEDKYTFVRHIERAEGVSIIGPSEHN